MPSAPTINAMNEQLRASPEYADWMRKQGIDPSRPIRLSDRQRKDFASHLRARGWQMPNGAEVDPAGNINENEGFGRQAKKWGPLVGAGAVTAFGVPGLFPGLIGGGGGTAATAAGATGASRTAAGGGLGMGGWLQTALFAGLPAVTNLFGAKMQTGAIDRSATIEAQSAREALDEIRRQYDLDRSQEEERYQADVTAFAPYNDVGGRLVTRAGDLLQNYTPQAYTPVPVRDREGTRGPTSMAAAFTPPRSSMADLQRAPVLGQGGPPVSTTQPVPRDSMASLTGSIPMVMLEAPTGERKAVPIYEAEGYMRRGARRV